jgi:hypothetical protein
LDITNVVLAALTGKSKSPFYSQEIYDGFYRAGCGFPSANIRVGFILD